jgi:hypothetical protein
VLNVTENRCAPVTSAGSDYRRCPNHRAETLGERACLRAVATQEHWRNEPALGDIGSPIGRRQPVRLLAFEHEEQGSSAGAGRPM